MTLIPMAYYVVQAGLIGMALIYGGFWGILAVVWLAAVIAAMAFNKGRPKVATGGAVPAE
jgi:lactate permease